jgi:uncharacterized protein (UPF0332 family)
MARPEAEDIQRERRRRRAQEGAFKVTALSAGELEGRYAVRGASGNTYEVEVLSAQLSLALCTCPDYETNTLLTCKHVEATWSHLERAEPAALREAQARRPSAARVYLHQGEELEVRLLRPEAPAPELAAHLDLYFDAEGSFIGELWRDFGGFARGAAALGGVIVDPEVHAFARERRRRTRRASELAEARRRALEGEELGLTRLPLTVWQRLGALHLAFTERAVLADDLGLGKTAQAIAAAELLRRDHGVKRVLVVCPEAHVAHWVGEVARFSGEAAARARGTPEGRTEVYAREAVYTVVPEEVLPADSEALARLRPELLILDGAQRIRDWRSRTADEVKRLATRFAFVLVDGPPQNDLDHLYSIVQLVDQRLLGPLWRFNPRYFVLDERGKVHGTRNHEELANRIAPVLLRRTWAEVSGDPPPRGGAVLRVPPSFPSWARGEEAREKLRVRKRLDRRAGEALGELRKLFDEAEDEHAPKLRELVALVSESLAGEDVPVAVVASSKELLEAAGSALDAAGIPQRRLGEGRDDEARVTRVLDQELADLPGAPGGVLVELDVPWAAEDWDRRSRLAFGRRLRLLAEGTVEETLHELHREAPHVIEELGLKGTAHAPRIAEACGREAWQALLGPPGAPPRKTRRQAEAAPEPTPAPPPPPERKQATLFDAPEEDRPPPASPPEAAPDLATHLAPVLGNRLVGVEPLGSGRVVVVKDQADKLRGTVRALARGVGVRPVVVDADTYAELRKLVPKEASAAPAGPSIEERVRSELEGARAKLDAAQALLDAGMAEEALGPAYRAMDGAARAMLHRRGQAPGDDEELVAAVYRGLVREGLLGAELAGGLSRARDLVALARQGDQPLVDAPLARAVVQDARRLLEAATLEA